MKNDTNFDAKTSGKHKDYQVLPDFLTDLDDPDSTDESLRLDRERFAWMERVVAAKSGETLSKVTDIGANLGYFSFMFGHRFEAEVTCYEPFQTHALGIERIAKSAGWGDEKISIREEGVDLDRIESLADGDLLILLNVLHHAGEDFDADKVKSRDDWDEYAVDYLGRLGQKFDSMIFQLGYAWKGHGERLCTDQEIPAFTADLLNRAGWEVKACGISKSLVQPAYEDVPMDQISSFGIVEMPSEPGFIGKVLRKLGVGPARVDGRLARFVQRPLYYCERKGQLK